MRRATAWGLCAGASVVLAAAAHADDGPATANAPAALGAPEHSATEVTPQVTQVREASGDADAPDALSALQARAAPEAPASTGTSIETGVQAAPAAPAASDPAAAPPASDPDLAGGATNGAADGAWSPSLSEQAALGEPVNASPLGERAPRQGRSLVTSWLPAMDSRVGELIRVGGALAVVLGLLLLTRVVLRRATGGLAGGRPSGVLEVLARYPVGRGQALLLVKLARRVVLVHHSGGAMTALSEITDRDEVAALLGRLEAGSAPREAGRFRAQLASFQSEHERLTENEIVDLTRPRRRVPA